MDEKTQMFISLIARRCYLHFDKYSDPLTLSDLVDNIHDVCYNIDDVMEIYNRYKFSYNHPVEFGKPLSLSEFVNESVFENPWYQDRGIPHWSDVEKIKETFTRLSMLKRHSKQPNPDTANPDDFIRSGNIENADKLTALNTLVDFLKNSPEKPDFGIPCAEVKTVMTQEYLDTQIAETEAKLAELKSARGK